MEHERLIESAQKEKDVLRVRKKEKHEKQLIKKKVFESKICAINERRHALTYTTLFYLISVHKIEKSVLEACPLIVRQSLFILFAHHIVQKGCMIKKLLGFKSITDFKRRAHPIWRATLDWMHNSIKLLAKAIEIPNDDRFSQRVIRGMDEFTDMHLFPAEVLERRRHKREGEEKINVIVNPMGAKRLLLNYSEAFTKALLHHLEEKQMVVHTCVQRSPGSPSAEHQSVNDKETWSVNMSAVEMLELQNKYSSSGRLINGAVVVELAERISHLPTITTDLVANAQPVDLPELVRQSLLILERKSESDEEVCEGEEQELKDSSSAFSVEDCMAFVINDVPRTTASDCPPTAPALPTGPSKFHSTPYITHAYSQADKRGGSMPRLDLNVMSRSSDARSRSLPDGSPCVADQALTAPPAYNNDCNTPPGATFGLAADGSVLVSVNKELQDDGLACSSTSEKTESEPPNSAPVIRILPPDCDDLLQVLSVLNIQVVMLWLTLFRLLFDGKWDSDLETVGQNVAGSLDMNRQFFKMLLAYAADAVCDLVHGKETEEGIKEGLAQVETGELKQLVKRRNAYMKGLKIAGMSVGVGALSALTAGLAAPAFAAGFGALGIAGTSGLAAFLGSAGGAASLASIFGTTSASLSGWKYSRRLAQIRVCEFVRISPENRSPNHAMDAIAGYIHEVIEYRQHTPYVAATHGHAQQLLRNLPSQDQCATTRGPKGSGSTSTNKALLTLNSISKFNQLYPQHVKRPLGLHHLQQTTSNRVEPPFHLIIGVSGWLKDSESATQAWNCLRDCIGTESYAFKWEPQLLTELGSMMIRLVSENVAYQATTWSIQIAMSASAGFIMWPVSFLQYAGQLDNAWMTAKDRAQQAGVILAAAICDKALVGNRPVTLIGCSMGSRVIAYCLKELFSLGQLHRVSDVVLMGLPDGKTKDDWRKMRAVVTGRLINVYNSNDLILIFLYRWMEWGVQVAGLSAVEGVPGVENFNATHLVPSHYEYEDKLPDILAALNIHSTLMSYVSINGNS